MRKREAIAIIATLLLIACTSVPVRAQDSFSLDESMACFRESSRISAPCKEGVIPIANVIYRWRNWDPAVVNQVAEALIADAASSDVKRSIHAIVALGQFGAPNGRHGELEGWPEAVEHLEQAFLVAPHPEYVLSTMARQTDRAAAIRFLSRVVRGELRPDAVVSRRLAAQDLLRAGPAGAAELRSIQSEGLDEPAVAHEVDRLLSEKE